MSQLNTKLPIAVAVALVLGSAVPVMMTPVQAGGFLAASSAAGSVTFPSGYAGNGGQLDVKVCIVPNAPNAMAMEQSIKNNVAVWNKLQSSSSNLRNAPLPSNSVDFESVALHEVGHCIGASHPNVASTRGIAQENTDYTESGEGTNGTFDFNPGPDGIKGSADDERGDDINRHFFYAASNNPFSEQSVVDASTYRIDSGSLPLGDTFAANGDRQVSGSDRYRTPNTEAVMQQGTFGSEIQRTLGHDDVSTIRYGMSGIDNTQGSADDYNINLVYGGISSAADCDINVTMDATRTGFAVCSVSGFFAGDDLRISTATMTFNPMIDWYFNDQAPCNESFSLTADAWRMISLPCQVGISSSAAVRDVLADDLGVATYATDWVVFAYEYTEQANGLMAGAYRQLTLDDELDSVSGYWIITKDDNVVVDVQGEYNSQMDAEVFIDSAAGQSYGWNLVGMPYRYPVTWADTVVVDSVGELLSLPEADPLVAGNVVPGGSGTACTQSSLPAADCLVAQFAFSYNEAIEDYDLLGPTSGALDKFDAAWVLAGASDFKVRFPMPPAERSTP